MAVLFKKGNSSSQELKASAYVKYASLSENTSPRTRMALVEISRHRWRDGHYFWVLCCTLAGGTILLFNVILTVIIRAKYGMSGGVATIQDGDCDEIKRLGLWLHLLINVLSTLLLGASNYSMQCLCAPTRQDIDKAHRQYEWMDIGVPSVRNFNRISRSRKLLWSLLLISSIPLHIMYNSVIFSSTSINMWAAFAVTSNFLTGAPINRSDLNLTRSGTLQYPQALHRLERLQNSTSLVRLENEACLATYNKPLINDWGDFLLISTQPNVNESLVSLIYEFSLTNEMCERLPPIKPKDFATCAFYEQADPNNWTLNNSVLTSYNEDDKRLSGMVSYCMADKAQEHCKIHFSMLAMTIVIASNLIKTICMGTIVWRLDPFPLVTIGDAIASFLDCPDPMTVSNCLSPKARFEEARTWARLPSRYGRRRRKWSTSASPARWGITIMLYASALGTVLGLLFEGIDGIGGDAFSLGFGAINVAATISNTGNLLSSIQFANAPQLVLSFLYFAYNALWTHMLLAQEWSSYADERKYLRVTSPRGGQRSTYRLQLPYRYGIPLLVVFGALHWLVSQSIFLVVLDAYKFDGTPDTNLDDSITQCGYSPIAILITLIIGSIVLILGIANGFRRYPMNGMPLAGSCSAAISAACHPPAGDDQASIKPVMWGACCGIEEDGDWDRVVELEKETFDIEKDALRRRKGGKRKAKVGHCSFTSFGVKEPILGKFYAGLENQKK